MRNINFFIKGDTVLLIIFLLLVFLIYIINSKYKFESDKRIFLFDLLILILLILYFFKPGINYQSSYLKKKKILLLTDKSISSISRKKIVTLNKNREILFEKIKSAGFDPVHYSFGSILKKEPVLISDFLKADTRILDAFKILNRKYPKDIEAVFLVSDGNFEKTRNDIKLPYRIFPIIPGSIEKRRRGINHIRIRGDQTLKKGVKSAVEVSYSTFRKNDIIDFYIDGKLYQSKVSEKGTGCLTFKYKPLFEREIAIGAAFRRKDLDDFTLDDKITVLKTVKRDKKKIVLAYGNADPELRYLNDFLRESSNYKVIFNGRITDKSINRKIKKSELMILIAPGKIHGQGLSSAIKKRIKDGMGFIYLNGEGNNDIYFLKDILPFKANRIIKVKKTDKKMLLTGIGEKQGLMMFISGINNDQNSGVIEYFNSGLIPKGDAVVLAKVGSEPVLMRLKKGSGNIISLNAGPTWKWDFVNLAFGLKTRFYQNFWSYLIEESVKFGSYKYILRLYENNLLPEESFKFTIITRGQKNKNNLNIQIRDIYTKKVIQTIMVEKKLPNIYKGMAVIKKFGCYDFVIRENRRIIKLGKKIIVSPRKYEYKNPFINLKSLKRLANKTGGRIIKKVNLKDLKLNNQKVKSFKEDSFYFLNNWIALILINLCFIYTIYMRWDRLE